MSCHNMLCKILQCITCQMMLPCFLVSFCNISAWWQRLIWLKTSVYPSGLWQHPINKTRTACCVRSHHVTLRNISDLSAVSESIDEVSIAHWSPLLFILSSVSISMSWWIRKHSVAAGHPLMLMLFSNCDITHVPMNCSMEGRIPAENRWGN